MPLTSNPSALGEGGLSVATAGENLYAPYFGELYLGDSGYRTLDPTQKRPSTIRNLPDAYQGNNERLLTRIEEQMIFNSDFLVKKVLPMRDTDKLEYTWNKWVFNNTLLRPVPYQGTSRYLSNQVSQDKKSTTRYGVAFILEHDFMKTEAGRLNYEYNLRSIGFCVNETHSFEIIRALVGANKDIELWTKQMSFYKNKSFQSIMEQERDDFAVLQKQKNGFDKMKAMATERIMKYGGEANLWLIEPILKYYVSLVPPEKTDYNIAGPDGPARVKNAGGSFEEGNPNLIFGNDVTAHLVRQFNYDNHEDLCAMQRQRSIGEFNTMLPMAGENPRSYHREQRNIVIYNEDQDDWHLVTLESAILNCNMFQARPGGNGLHNLDESLYKRAQAEMFQDDLQNPFLMEAGESSGTPSMSKSTVQMKPIQVFGHLSPLKYDSSVFSDVGDSIVAQLSKSMEGKFETILNQIESVSNKIWSNREELQGWLRSLATSDGSLNNAADIRKIAPSSSRYRKYAPYNVVVGNTGLTTITQSTPNVAPTGDNVANDWDLLRNRIGSTNYKYWKNHPDMVNTVIPALRKVAQILPNCALLDEKLCSSDYEMTDSIATFFENALGLSQFRVFVNPQAVAIGQSIADGGHSGGNVARPAFYALEKSLITESLSKWKPVIQAFNRIDTINRNLGTLLGYYAGGLIYDPDVDVETINISNDPNQNGTPSWGVNSAARTLIVNNYARIPFANMGFASLLTNFTVSAFIAQMLNVILDNETITNDQKRNSATALLQALYTNTTELVATNATQNSNATSYANIRTKGEVGNALPTPKTTNKSEQIESVLEWVMSQERSLNMNAIGKFVSHKRESFANDMEVDVRYTRANLSPMISRFYNLSNQELQVAPGRDETDFRTNIFVQLGNLKNQPRIGSGVERRRDDAPTLSVSSMVRTTVTLSARQFVALYDILYKTPNAYEPLITVGSLDDSEVPASADELSVIYKTLTAQPGSQEYKQGINRYPQLVAFAQNSTRASFLSALGLYQEPSQPSADNASIAFKRSRYGNPELVSYAPYGSRGTTDTRKVPSHVMQATTGETLSQSFTKTSNGVPIKNERLLNHWHNVQNAPNASLLVQAITRCVLMTPFSQEALINLYRNNCIVPVGFILARPHMVYTTSMAIYLLPGPRTGNLMVGHRDFQLGNDPKIKVFFGHFTLHSAAVVTGPENVRVIYDVFSKECLGGGGVRFWSRDLIPKYAPASGKTTDADMFCFMVSSQENKNSGIRNPIDVSGHMSYLDAPGIVASNVEYLPHYSTAGFYNRLFKFRTLEHFYGHSTSTINFYHPYHPSALFQQYQYNTICWHGAQGTYNHETKLHDNLKLNTGHWGENIVGPGAKSIRGGKLTSPKTITEIRASIQL